MQHNFQNSQNKIQATVLILRGLRKSHGPWVPDTLKQALFINQSKILEMNQKLH